MLNEIHEKGEMLVWCLSGGEGEGGVAKFNQLKDNVD